MEESVYMNIALEAIRIAVAPLGNINVSTEIFLPDWHLVRLRVEPDRLTLGKEEFMEKIKNLYINEKILTEAKRVFSERVNGYPTVYELININDVLQECIMHFIYGEPMPDAEEERVMALLYMVRIGLDDVNDFVRKIIKEMR